MTTQAPNTSFITFKFRVRSGDRHLSNLSGAVNQVWNFCVATTREAERRHRRWPTAFDLINLTSGCSDLLGINSRTIGAVCRQFVQSRDQHRKCPRFRPSRGAKRALGWLPFDRKSISVKGNLARYFGRSFAIWKHREIHGLLTNGGFVQDSSGKWYLTLCCRIENSLPSGIGQIGIDLGLKDLATTSDGEHIAAQRHYRQYAQQLATAQRARNRDRVRAIHAKIANARRHNLHEQSTRIARENRLIAVGNVSPSKLAKTKMAKSVLDAGWASFRHMLRYKAARRQAVYVDVDERWSSQVCSACGSLPPSRPKGIADLGMRSWECSDCGTAHDRDVNAARNILRAGLECQPPVGGKALKSRLEHY